MDEFIKNKIYHVDWEQLNFFGYPAFPQVPEMLFDSGLPGIRCHPDGDDNNECVVAIVPIALAALNEADTKNKEQLLAMLYDFWIMSKMHVSPFLAEPPNGHENVPTPTLDDQGAAKQKAQFEDLDNQTSNEMGENQCPPRPKDLCAWQIAKGVEGGIPVYRILLQDEDPAVAGAAAKLLSLWPR